MNAEDLTEKIVDFVHARDYVTYGELINTFGKELEGDMCYELADYNIVLMIGVSTLFCDAMNRLKDEQPKRVVLDDCHYLTYFIDGCPWPKDMPLAKRPPKNGYKKPHYGLFCLRPWT